MARDSAKVIDGSGQFGRVLDWPLKNHGTSHQVAFFVMTRVAMGSSFGKEAKKFKAVAPFSMEKAKELEDYLKGGVRWGSCGTRRTSPQVWVPLRADNPEKKNRSCRD